MAYIHSLKTCVGLSPQLSKSCVTFLCLDFLHRASSVVWNRQVESKKHILSEIERLQGCIFYFDKNWDNFEKKETLSNCYFLPGFSLGGRL